MIDTFIYHYNIECRKVFFLNIINTLLFIIKHVYVIHCVQNCDKLSNANLYCTFCCLQSVYENIAGLDMILYHNIYMIPKSVTIRLQFTIGMTSVYNNSSEIIVLQYVIKLQHNTPPPHTHTQNKRTNKQSVVL